MINLEKTSGLPIEVTDDFHLKFSAPMKETTPSVRTFSEMLPVLMDQSAQVTPPRQEMYYMYRGLFLPEDEQTIKANNLSYDITVLPPYMLGQEFGKMLGHYHSNLPGSSIAYPEMYEVLHGHGLFLIQKMDPEFKNLISVYAIEAMVGDKVIYPPNYGHTFINLENEVMITANWSTLASKSLYKPIAEYRGLAYYIVKDANKPYIFVENKNYTGRPEVKIINNQEKVYANFGFKPQEPMYVTFIKDPKKLDFLTHPGKHAIELSTLTS